MKSYGITMVGALVAIMFGCHVSVDDYCDDDDDWDDDEEPCETHIHSDTTSTTGGSTTTVGAGGGSSNVSVTTGGASSGSGGSGGNAVASGGSAAGGSDSGGTGGASATGGNAGSVSGTGGGTVDGGDGGSVSDGSTTGAAGESSTSATSTSGSACTDCMTPDKTSCLWGTTTMDACCTADVLVDIAAQGCAGVDLTLREFALEEACDGGHYQVSYQCCLIPQDTCTERSARLEVCVAEDVLMSLAEQWCGETGQVVADILPGDECADGTSQSVQATCCGE
jgi:hypothetical protein